MIVGTNGWLNSILKELINKFYPIVAYSEKKKSEFPTFKSYINEKKTLIFPEIKVVN